MTRKQLLGARYTQLVKIANIFDGLLQKDLNEREKKVLAILIYAKIVKVVNGKITWTVAEEQP